MKSTICVLLFAAIAFAVQPRETTVTITDNSSGVLAFAGSVHITESESTLYPGGTDSAAKGMIEATNISPKPIIAMQGWLRIAKFHVPEQKILYTHDFYFKNMTIAPGKALEISVSPPTQSMGSAWLESKPSLKVELLFVQFDDGSIWGDQVAAEKIISQRPQVKSYLESLLAAYSTGGEKMLINEMRKEQPARTLVFSLSHQLQGIQEQFGTDAVVKNIQNRLKSAEARKATGKF